MRLTDTNRLQTRVWRRLGEDVEVGGVAASAIYDPDDADVPGTELARRSSRVLRLAFRRSAGLDLSRGTLIVFRESYYEIDGSPDVADDIVYVSLLPTNAPPVTPAVPGGFSGGFSGGFRVYVPAQ